MPFVERNIDEIIEQEKEKDSEFAREWDKSRNQYNKMTTEPVGRLLAELSVPTVISMMVTTLYNMVDTAFVGTLGTSESGATGVVFGYMAILQAVAFMCGQGAGSIMSRRLGEKKLEEACEYASTGFFLSFALGAFLAVLSAFFLTPLLYLLGSTSTIAPFARTYIICILLSAPFFTSSLTMNNLLRYEGKAKLGTVGLLIGAIMNIGLDALLMFVFRMGILGAGIATAFSQLLSFLILLSMFLVGRTQTKISFTYLTGKVGVAANILATGFPSLLRQGLSSVATMVLNRAARVYGDGAVSAMSIVSRISFFPMAVAIGIGQGFQPISSFNFGAGKKERVRKAFWTALFASEVVLCMISIPVFLLAGNLVQLFRNDVQVVNYGTRALQLMCVGQWFVPLTMMVEMGFQSTGQRLLASIASCMRSGIMFIPVLIVLAGTRGMAGVQEAQPISFVLTFVVCIFLCRVFLKRIRE